MDTTEELKTLETQKGSSPSDDNVLAIDPGRKKLAWALFTNGKLNMAGVYRFKPNQNPDLNEIIAGFTKQLAQGFSELDLTPCSVAVVERMKVYPGKGSKGDQNYLLDLQAIGTAVGSKLAVNLRLVYPIEWKKNQPKDVSHRKIRSALSSEETTTLKEAEEDVGLTYLADLLDAVGIGLFQLGRYR